MYSDDIQSTLKDIDDYVSEEYLKTHPLQKEKRDWRTYGQQFARRVCIAMTSLKEPEPACWQVADSEANSLNGGTETARPKVIVGF